MPTTSARRRISRARRPCGLFDQIGREDRCPARGVTRSHDLAGMLSQWLIADRKFLATYYTQPEAAALLAALALAAERPTGAADWGEGETLAAVEIGDLACGTGTLLSAADHRITLLHQLHGGEPRALHGPMMRHGLVGLDVRNRADAHAKRSASSSASAEVREGSPVPVAAVPC